MVHTTALDFSFRPTSLIGYNIWYDHTLPHCQTFQDFITHLSKSKKRLMIEQREQISAFFDIYVKLLNASAHKMETFIQELISYYRSKGLNSHKSLKELETLLEKDRMNYSKHFLEYYEQHKLANPEDIEKSASQLMEQKKEGYDMTPADVHSQLLVRSKLRIIKTTRE